MIKRSSRLLAFFLITVIPGFAQVGDGCHVYVVDVAAVEASQRSSKNCTDAAKCGVTTFPEFKPVLLEEELTQKEYKFPYGPEMITAKVFPTDESMPSSSGADSVLLSITLAPKVLTNVLLDENSAGAEFSLVDADAGRVKRYYKVRGKSYLVGMECHFKRLEIK